MTRTVTNEACCGEKFVKGLSGRPKAILPKHGAKFSMDYQRLDGRPFSADDPT
jgi:hypothetical protein